MSIGGHAIRHCQEVSFEVLLEFGRVCRGLGLRYYLTAGTLLGAVRHQGFIPWDDDIDVFPLDRCPESDGPAKLLFKGIELLDCAVLARVSTEFECGYRKASMRFAWNVPRQLPNGWIFTLREGLRKLLGGSGQLLCTVGGTMAIPGRPIGRSGLSRQWSWNLKGVPFPSPWGGTSC